MNQRASVRPVTPAGQRDNDAAASASAAVSASSDTPRGVSALLDWMLNPPDSAPRATILIRCMAGSVFLWEGILKFVYTNQGVGRFTKLGFAAPALTADCVAVLEIVGG